MMKNFTKILLGLLALATSFSASAEMEWREVSKTDFGGNDKNAESILSTKPDMNTGLTYITVKELGYKLTTGNYMIIKATQLADIGSYFSKPNPNVNLTNSCDAVEGLPCWAEGGDHTNPDDPSVGYYMVFDCNEGSVVKLYEKSLGVNCRGVSFELKAYFASLDRIDGGKVRVSIQNGGKTLQSSILEIPAATSGKISWQPISTEFKLDENSSYESIDFLVEAIDCMGPGWDIAMDDITISVNQPKIGITASKFYYKQPATLKATYDQDEFDAFLGKGDGDIEYRWYKFDEDSQSYSQIYKGKYTANTDISYTIPSFEKENDNGKYKVVVASAGNSENSLCSIQKEFVVNEEKNEVYIEICKDSTVVTEFGHTLSTTQYDDQYVDFESIAYDVKCIKYTPLDTKYDPQCKNDEYNTVGDIRLDDIIERDPNNGCPLTVQKHYLRVTDNIVTNDPKHLCEGAIYKDSLYADVDEKGLTRIEFEEDGCNHEQYVFVHPKKSVELPVRICKGEYYDSIPYNTPGTSKGKTKTYKTIWGCDSIVTPMITVSEPVTVDLGDLVLCPSDQYEFDGKVYDYAIDTVLTSVDTAANGCDSTTIIHLHVNEGGRVEMDTLICREQILWGEEFSTAGSQTRVRSGRTASGCSIDTVWHIEVVDITLNLRMFGNQDQICLGQPASMTATLKAYEPNGKKLSPTYHWEPEIPTNTLTPSLYLEETTTYTIYADLDLPSDVDKNAKGCHATASQTITVNPVPELTIDSVNPEDRSVEYTVVGGTMPYHMYLGQKDLGTMVVNEGKEERLPYGNHTLQVQDSTGCASDATFSIAAIELIPSKFFSPNNDDPHCEFGACDRWVIKNIDVYPQAYIRVFDRYGKMVFQSRGEDYNPGWDGTYNGNPLPATDYWYEIDVEDIDKQYIGHFTLIR